MVTSAAVLYAFIIIIIIILIIVIIIIINMMSVIMNKVIIISRIIRIIMITIMIIHLCSCATCRSGQELNDKYSSAKTGASTSDNGPVQKLGGGAAAKLQNMYTQYINHIDLEQSGKCSYCPYRSCSDSRERASQIFQVIALICSSFKSYP